MGQMSSASPAHWPDQALPSPVSWNLGSGARIRPWCFLPPHPWPRIGPHTIPCMMGSGTPDLAHGPYCLAHSIPHRPGNLAAREQPPLPHHQILDPCGASPAGHMTWLQGPDLVPGSGVEHPCIKECVSLLAACPATTIFPPLRGR